MLWLEMNASIALFQTQGGLPFVAWNGHRLRDMGPGTSKHEDDQLPCHRSRMRSCGRPHVVCWDRKQPPPPLQPVGIYHFGSDPFICKTVFLQFAIISPFPATQWLECGAAPNTRYLRLQSKLSWGQARDACSRIVPGSHLATPRSANQSGCVHFARNGDSSSHWIGIRSFDAGQSYVYIDNNQPIGPYTNWTANEPRLTAGFVCVTMWSPGREYGWDNYLCSATRSAICQRTGLSNIETDNGLDICWKSLKGQVVFLGCTFTLGATCCHEMTSLLVTS